MEDGKKNLSGLVIGQVQGNYESEKSVSVGKINWFVNPFSLVQPDSGCVMECSPQLSPFQHALTNATHGDPSVADSCNKEKRSELLYRYDSDMDPMASKQLQEQHQQQNTIIDCNINNQKKILFPPIIPIIKAAPGKEFQKNNSLLKRYQSPVRRASPISASSSSTAGGNLVVEDLSINHPSSASSGSLFAGETGGVSIELCRICGSGSYATVYEGWSSELGKSFAVKVIRLSECREGYDEGELGDPSSIASIVYREVELHRKAMTPKHNSNSNNNQNNNQKNNDIGSIINLYGYSQARIASNDDDFEEDHLFLIMEYTPLPDLFDLTIQNNGMGCSKTKVIMQQLISAVEKCHANGVYHRDIKPENVLFVEEVDDEKTFLSRRNRRRRRRNSSSNSNIYHNPNHHNTNHHNDNCKSSLNHNNNGEGQKTWNHNWRVRLSDFGLATDTRICTDRAVGSLPYMSPEAYNNNNNNGTAGYNSEAADIWSLGVIFFSIRFAKTLWTVPHCEEDSNYAAFSSDPLSLKRAFNLSRPAYNMVIRMLDPCPQTRCTLSEVKSLLSRINEFVAVEQEEDENEAVAVDEEYDEVVNNDGHLFGTSYVTAKSHFSNCGSRVSSDNGVGVGGVGVEGFKRNTSSTLLLEEMEGEPIPMPSDSMPFFLSTVDELCESNVIMMKGLTIDNSITDKRRRGSSISDTLTRSRKDSGISKSYASSWGDLDEEKMDFSKPLEFFSFHEDYDDGKGKNNVIGEDFLSAAFPNHSRYLYQEDKRKHQSLLVGAGKQVEPKTNPRPLQHQQSL